PAMSGYAVVWQTAWAVARSRVKDVSRQIAEREAVRREVWAELASLLRDVIPSPFHPVLLDPAWRTPTVISIGTVIYDERQFEDLPILADALEEAGCSQEEILSHCRGPGPHARGCWLLEAILGRA